MDRQQKGILTLIRSAVTGQPLTLPQNFDLEAAMPLIKTHNIAPLVCQGALSCGLPPSGALLAGYGKSLRQSEGQLLALNQLTAAFEKAHIHYMPLKGTNTKALYPKPELRVMGDADILIRMEQYDQIKPILEDLGYEFLIESNHELIWNSPCLHLELHKRLIPSYNTDYAAYFGDGWRLARKGPGSRYSLSAEDDFIYQFTHFAKHYREGGIGCRHVTDLWVYLLHFTDMDTAYLEKELEKLQLLEFYGNIRRLIEAWFADGPEDERTSFISDFIFRSGNWGMEKDHVVSAELRHVKAGGSIAAGRARSVMAALFPSLETLRQPYPVLKKAPWLLPLIWPVRWVTTLLFRGDAIRARQKKWATASPAEIRTYQDALNYVGLDFRFEK